MSHFLLTLSRARAEKVSSGEQDSDLLVALELSWWRPIRVTAIQSVMLSLQNRLLSVGSRPPADVSSYVSCKKTLNRRTMCVVLAEIYGVVG